MRPVFFSLLLLGLAVGIAHAQDVPDPPPADPVALRVMVRGEALRSGMPPQIADAVAQVESGYNTGARGDAGEVGLMQILPGTARMLGFIGSNTELAAPANNIRYGVSYLSGAWRLAGGDICTTVMKYRAGHGETRFSQRSVAYCQRVRSILAEQGYPVTGTVPQATFGEPATMASVGSGGIRRKGGRTRSRIDWAGYSQRVKAIESRITASSLSIMQ